MLYWFWQAKLSVPEFVSRQDFPNEIRAFDIDSG